MNGCGTELLFSKCFHLEWHLRAEQQQSCQPSSVREMGFQRQGNKNHSSTTQPDSAGNSCLGWLCGTPQVWEILEPNGTKCPRSSEGFAQIAGEDLDKLKIYLNKQGKAAWGSKIHQDSGSFERFWWVWVWGVWCEIFYLVSGIWFGIFCWISGFWCGMFCCVSGVWCEIFCWVSGFWCGMFYLVSGFGVGYFAGFQGFKYSQCSFILLKHQSVTGVDPSAALPELFQECAMNSVSIPLKFFLSLLLSLFPTSDPNNPKVFPALTLPEQCWDSPRFCCSQSRISLEFWCFVSSPKPCTGS